MADRTKSIKPSYRKTIEATLIITLSLIIFFFFLFPTLKRPIKENKIVHLDIVVENIPITRQSSYRPPPPKPAIPIPTEEETVPTDETIAETELNFDTFPFAANGALPGYTSPSFIAPRPIAEVIPEYPKEEYKRGVTGTIKLHVNIDQNGKVIEVVVLENTTQSELCAEAAIKAAYQCRYIPARQGNKPVACWTTRLIKFDIPR